MYDEEKKGDYGSESAHPMDEKKNPFAPEPPSKRKVERTDGLPTVEDLAKMFGKKNPMGCDGCEHGCEDCMEETEGDRVGKMVEIILKIG